MQTIDFFHHSGSFVGSFCMLLPSMEKNVNRNHFLKFGRGHTRQGIVLLTDLSLSLHLY